MSSEEGGDGQQMIPLIAPHAVSGHPAFSPVQAERSSAACGAHTPDRSFSYTEHPAQSDDR
jgi:hypothetical protein